MEEIHNKNKQLIALLEAISAENIASCQLVSSFDHIDCVGLKLSFLSQKTIHIITALGFSLVNVYSIPAKDLLSVTIRFGHEPL